VTEDQKPHSGYPHRF